MTYLHRTLGLTAHVPGPERQLSSCSRLPTLGCCVPSTHFPCAFRQCLVWTSHYARSPALTCGRGRLGNRLGRRNYTAYPGLELPLAKGVPAIRRVGTRHSPSHSTWSTLQRSTVPWGFESPRTITAAYNKPSHLLSEPKARRHQIFWMKGPEVEKNTICTRVRSISLRVSNHLLLCTG